MTREEVEQFKKRWAMVNDTQAEELRNTPIEEKFRQLADLMAWARGLGWDEALAAEEAAARKQWQRLRDAYGA
jgi:hypothetical protein